jgi:hopanoid biosynthesis associated protein HpnK
MGRKDEGNIRLICNADDFGHSESVNAGVLRAHRKGVLTSTSLMVAADAAEQAVALATQTPSLAVGLHLVLINGKAVLPHKDIPHLVDANGRFRNDAVRAGIYYFTSRTAQRELLREMVAQFDHFAATGLPLSHCDGHLLMHVHPTVMDLLIPLAEQHGAHGLRLPRDDLRLSLKHSRRSWGLKIVWTLLFGLICRWCSRRLRTHHLAVTDRVYGLLQSGHMDEAYVVDLLKGLNSPTAEIYFHPSEQDGGVAYGPNRADLNTLLSRRVYNVIRERGIQLVTYASLHQTGFEGIP